MLIPSSLGGCSSCVLLFGSFGCFWQFVGGLDMPGVLGHNWRSLDVLGHV